MNNSIMRLLATTALVSLAGLGHAERTAPGLHVVLQGGLTFGGDTVATAVFDNDDKVDIKAGELLQLGAGVLWQSGPAPLAVLATANYQISGTTAENGKAQFTRIPYELIAYYTGLDKWRFGVGFRHVTAPEVSYKVNGGEDNIEFKDARGRLVEIGYQLTPNVWLNLRGVAEKYQPETYRLANGNIAVSADFNKRYDGQHIGIYLLGEF